MKKPSVRSCTVIVAVVFLLFYLLVRLTPLYADDYTYSYSFEGGFGSQSRNETITNIQSLVRSQIGHYQSMNGRVVAHTLAQIFLALDKSVFDVAGSLAFVLLGLLICFHGNGDFRSIRPMHLILTYASLFLLVPSFGQSYLWLTGSCNYLFTFVIVLLFLIPYRRSFYLDRKAGGFVCVFSGVFMGFAGVLAGNTNENTGVSLAVMLTLYLAAFFLKFRRIRIWMLTGYAGTIAGCVGCILAPGNLIRNGGSAVRFSFGGIIKYTIFYTAQMLQYFAPLLVVMAVMLSCIYITERRKGRSNREILLCSLKDHFFLYFYFIFFLGAVYAMTVPAQFPPRAWSHPLALLVIVTLTILNEFIESIRLNPEEYKRFSIAVSTVLVVVSAVIYLSEYPKVNAVAFAHAQRIERIEEAKANGETEARVCSIVSTSRYVCHDYQGDISDNSAYWTNLGLAKFYGIETVTKDCDCIV